MRSLAAFVMQGRLQAAMAIIALALASMLLPLLNLLGAAALALVALRKGVLESAWVLAISAPAVGIIGVLLSGNAHPFVLYGLLWWVLVWPLALLLRETLRLDWALAAASAMGLAAVAASYGLVEDPAAAWLEILQRLFQPMLEQAPADFDTLRMNKALELFSHYASGAMASGLVMSLILGLLIARWEQALLFNPGGFKAEFIGLRLPPALVYLGLGCIAAGMAVEGNMAEIAWNLSGVFFVLFAVAGFAIVHALLGIRTFWLVGIYLMLFFIPHLLLPIALLGFSDIWVDWRKRLNRA
ncbi:MAG: hypothetical protein PHE55_06560 [Methylococcaceae bacterium]|nr:hypothetical protein [Methylococcaceae bacterium]